MDSGDELTLIRRLLLDGRKQSGQLSYGRREPSAAAKSLFFEARRRVRSLLEMQPTNAILLELASEIDECLLDYDSAAKRLMLALSSGLARNSKRLKRLAALLEQSKWWNKLQLTPTELASLGQFLHQQHASGVPNHDRRSTIEWLRKHCKDQSEEILNAFDEIGAFSDFQILQNVVRG